MGVCNVGNIVFGWHLRALAEIIIVVLAVSLAVVVGISFLKKRNRHEVA